MVLPNRATLAIRNFFKLILARPQEIQIRAIEYAMHLGMDGLIMGHLHSPLMEYQDDGFFVGNTGDWVENSSLIIETREGEFLLINNGEVVDRFTM